MKEILMLVISMLLLWVMYSNTENVTVDRGIIKEKFITHPESIEPTYNAVTNDVYNISSTEYAKLKVGDHLIQQELQIDFK